ncbi:hypothetical protein MPTK1_8g08680 [Marchantia polymorpha subsp. ruderalis]|uniref:Uncharacterized protein n=1 Tax=Marchantia polymorpha TaxID=3197 RepID=A0A2R6WRM3_MARPO|nr:hypothetical protein MARPO_0063s0051 [Marchantia polymorpha]BBN19207.1 hypothetical protein Mp_8g08680 [Marchantia polymorpha subsp. ruderalis]|eukprot:PTQ36505.1 hypothetical protein MARPO_0063s0051 [Marchantia polymorpha]
MLTALACVHRREQGVRFDHEVREGMHTWSVHVRKVFLNHHPSIHLTISLRHQIHGNSAQIWAFSAPIMLRTYVVRSASMSDVW